MFVYEDSAKIPTTSSRTIIFPHSEMIDGFDSSYYSQILTNGRASPEEIEKVLEDANRNRVKFKTKFKVLACSFFLLVVLLSIALVLILEWYVSDQFFIWYLSGGIAVIFLVFTFGFYILFKYQSRCSIRCKKAAKSVIENHNEETFRKRGLRWVVPEAFPAWMELWKEYDEEDGTQHIFFAPQKIQSLLMSKRNSDSHNQQNLQKPLLS